MAIYLSQYHETQEISQRRCETADEAKSLLVELNTQAAHGWRWGLSPATFLDDNGAILDADKANEIRRACGVAEW